MNLEKMLRRIEWLRRKKTFLLAETIAEGIGGYVCYRYNVHPHDSILYALGLMSCMQGIVLNDHINSLVEEYNNKINFG